MSHLYAQKPIPAASNLKALALGALGTLLAFALLPALTKIADTFDKVPLEPMEDSPLVVPPDVKPEPPPKPVKKDQPKIKDLEPPLPPMTLEQMGLLITLSDNGTGVTVDSGRSFLDDGATDIGTFLPSELDQQPRALVAANPLYPYSLQQSKTPGKVVVEFVIDENGRVLRPRVIKSSHREFEQPALEAVLKSRWQAGRKNGQDVRALVRLPINFRP